MKSLEILDFNVFFRLHFGFASTSFLVILISGHESETKTMEFKLYNFLY